MRILFDALLSPYTTIWRNVRPNVRLACTQSIYHTFMVVKFLQEEERRREKKGEEAGFCKRYDRVSSKLISSGIGVGRLVLLLG